MLSKQAGLHLIGCTQSVLRANLLNASPFWDRCERLLEQIAVALSGDRFTQGLAETIVRIGQVLPCRESPKNRRQREPQTSLLKSKKIKMIEGGCSHWGIPLACVGDFAAGLLPDHLRMAPHQELCMSCLPFFRNCDPLWALWCSSLSWCSELQIYSISVM